MSVATAANSACSPSHAPSQGFARVEDVARVEGRLDALLQRVLLRAEFVREPPPLEGAHAVLPGEGAAQAQCGGEDVGRSPPGRVRNAGRAGVEDQDGVEVAVRGVREGED